MITEGPAAVTQMVKDCIRQEMQPEGLLSDVVTFVPAYLYEEEYEEPLVWIYEHETTGVDGNGTLFHKQLLQTPFEFFCVVYDEDLEQSEILGKDLATRVAAAIKKNIMRNGEDDSYIFDKVLFDHLYPSGTVDVVEKGDRAVTTSIKLTIQYYVDWNYLLIPEKRCPDG